MPCYQTIVPGCNRLRPSDLLRLTWNHVYDEEQRTFRSHIILTEKKTQKQRTIAINRQVVAALRLLLPNRRGSFIFASNRKEEKAISRVQAWRIIRVAAEAVGEIERIALYSLRKTAGYHAWKAGVSPVVLMDIYNHTSYAVTRRYLGVSQDDRDEVYLSLSLF